MIIHPEALADHGCWISDDRVYAFVSSAVGGITEIGYHGAQPPSRNAQVFGHQEGAVRFVVSDATGGHHRVAFGEVDWSPGSVTIYGSCPAGSILIEVIASGRTLFVRAGGCTGDINTLVIYLDSRALFTEVHGSRTWGVRRGAPGWMQLHFRDQILLDEWMKREGPYGPDFLIPETLRARIYRRPLRSGMATPADLRPEYQGVALPVYDADVLVNIGGEGYTVIGEDEATAFVSPRLDPDGSFPVFQVRFDGEMPCGVNVPRRSAKSEALIPQLNLPGFEVIERFFAAVPGLVESCVVRDYGVPRATPGGYYWIWAWDAMVTALVAMRWGETELAERTVSFVNAHRDNGRIPMRWTHNMEPLDTQEPGALETLLASLAYALSREEEAAVSLDAIYPFMLRHLDRVFERSDGRGLFANIGFYPDLPLRFGRTEQHAVAVEVAAFYSFCRTFENCAVLMNDETNARRARERAALLEEQFPDQFWDAGRGFIRDAVHLETGARHESFPVFSLLFLHHPPAMSLMRQHVRDAAEFIATQLLTPAGIRLLPSWDRNASSETVSGAWYPHWDAYALKLLRRAGRAGSIMEWLHSVASVLEHLGYAPEYLSLDASPGTHPAAWSRHGAASNLNCVTGWYQAILEGVLGLDFDPGGLTIVPLALPFPTLAVRGVRHLATRWNIVVRYHGPWLHGLRVDGVPVPGCMKVPKVFHDGGEHTVELEYAKELPGPRFLELANAEVLEVAQSGRDLVAVINALGQVDVVVATKEDSLLSLDGRPLTLNNRDNEGNCYTTLRICGTHTLLLSPGLG